MVPSSSLDAFHLSGGATAVPFRTDASCSGSNIRTGSPGEVARITLRQPLRAPTHKISRLSLSFRWVAGYPASGAASVVKVLLANAAGTTIASLFTSGPLSNYSHDAFAGYSPPLLVTAADLGVPNDVPLFVVVEVHNNGRNLQLPLDDLARGFNCTIEWDYTSGATSATRGQTAPARGSASGSARGSASGSASSSALSSSTTPPPAYPVQHDGNTLPGAEPVNAHPSGASPFGVEDLLGNVWQYTSEFRDNHTRFVILRGGSNYRPSGSSWYFPNQIELNTHNKYFLMDDRYERAGTIGFRCVVDAPGERYSATPPNFPALAEARRGYGGTGAGTHLAPPA